MADPTEKLLTYDREQLKYMKRIADSNKISRIILRSCVTGVFTALGTTVGFVVVLVIAGHFIGSIKNWPIIDQILSETKLDVLIENQLANLSGSKVQNADKSPKLFKDPVTSIQFSFPIDMNQVLNTSVAGNSNYHAVLEGTGVLNSIEVYINETPNIDDKGVSTQEYSAKVLGKDSKFKVYDDGIKIDEVVYHRAVFVFEYQDGPNHVVILGVANQDTPRTAREIFRLTIESIQKT